MQAGAFYVRLACMCAFLRKLPYEPTYRIACLNSALYLRQHHHTERHIAYLKAVRRALVLFVYCMFSWQLEPL